MVSLHLQVAYGHLLLGRRKRRLFANLPPTVVEIGPGTGANLRYYRTGTRLEAGQHVCALTGQAFTVAAVRDAGFEADLCLAGSEHPGLPAPGNIISGTVVLSAAINAPI